MRHEFLRSYLQPDPSNLFLKESQTSNLHTKREFSTLSTNWLNWRTIGKATATIGILSILGVAISIFQRSFQNTHILNNLNNYSNDVSDFEKLKSKIYDRTGQPLILNILDKENCHSLHVSNRLGNGGSKVVYQLGTDHVLTLPNMGVDPIAYISQGWARMVRDEFGNRKDIDSIGLLTLPLERVNLCMENCNACHNHSIPAYKAESFEHLKESRGWHILDKKNPKSSTWKEKIFENDKDRLDLKKWKPILTPLFNDIAKIVYYDLNIGTDQKNLVVIQTNDSNHPKYIRYFGFDFSKKQGKLIIQDRKPISDFGKEQLNFLDELLNDFLASIIDCEFPNKPYKESLPAWSEEDWKKEQADIIEFNGNQMIYFHELKNKIFNEYKESIENEVKQLIKINKNSLKK